MTAEGTEGWGGIVRTGVEQRTAAGATGTLAVGVVEMGVFGVVTALEPDEQDGEEGEGDEEDDDHDDPLVVGGPPALSACLRVCK